MTVEKIEINIDAKTSGFDKKLKGSTKVVDKLAARMEKVAKISAVAFTGLVASIGGFVNEAAKMESINTQFEVLIGNTEDAAKLMKQLSDFSAKTPFQFDAIAKASQQLLGFGFAAEEVVDLMQEIGDVASASGSPIQEISLIFGQVAAAGKLTGERLLQFQERAVPIGPALAKSMGVAESSIKDLVSKGKVSFEIFQKAFASISKEGGKAFGGMAKASETLSGRISTLKDNFSLVAAEIGKNIAPTIKRLTIFITDLLGRLRNSPELSELIAKLLVFGTALTGAVAAVSTLGAVLPLLIKGFALLKVAVVAFTGPLGIAVAVTAALAAGIVKTFDVLTERSGAIPQLTRNIEDYTDKIKVLNAQLARGEGTFSEKRIANIREEIAALEERRLKLEEQRNVLQTATTGEEAVEQQKVVKRKARDAERIAQAKELNETLALIEAEFVENKKEQERINEELKTAEDEERIALLQAKLANEQEIEKGHQLRLLAQDKKFKKAKAGLEKESDKREVASQKARLQTQQAYTNNSLALANNLSNLSVAISGKQGRALFLIQKAAAIAQAIVSTQLASVQALAVPPAPNVALAGVATAAGAANIATIAATAIKGFARGGLVSGGISGIDSVPIVAQRNELVSPPDSFDEVVEGVARERGFTQDGGNGGEITIGFTDNAFEIIEQKLLERQAIGIGAS